MILESQLGVQLFHRTTRQVHLTDAGEAMQLKMKRGLVAIDDACDEAQAIARVDRGVMQQGNPFGRSRLISWEQLQDEPLVLTARGTSTRESVVAALTRHGIGKPAEFEVASMPTSISLVRAGFGSTFISRVALLDTDKKGLKAVRMRQPALRRMGIYRRADRTASPAVHKFIELLKLEAAETLTRLR